MRRIFFYFYLLSVLFFIFYNFSFSQNINSFSLEKLWYFKEEEKSRESLFKNYSKIDVLAPQTFYLRFDFYKNEFYIKENLKQDIVDFAKEKNIKVLPLLANISYNKKGNEYFDRFLIHKFLDDQKAQEKIVNDMINIANKFNTKSNSKLIIGWQLDLEAINGEYKDKFTEFAKLMEREFQKNNLITSAAIVSKISDNSQDYEQTYWNKWASVYDYKALGETLDFISVMAYDQPKSKGPVATIDWSKKVLDYSLKNIPANKISFGIPSYGWVYRSAEYKKGKKHFMMTNFSVIENIKKQSLYDKKTKITGEGRSKKFGDIPWISYDKNNTNYTIWYEDKMSFETKLNNIKDKNIRGFSVWVLGDEDSKVWELF